MKEITDYGKVFETLVQETSNYLTRNNLNCVVLGISGGIDSTVCAAICHEVSKRTSIPLIGRSLPTKYNKEEEISTADLVGRAFCSDYKEVPIMHPYNAFLDFVDAAGDVITPIANGNIQARLRMMYLYNLASIHKGLVIDTDNLTEHNLGYWTIHGDVGDFNPIGGLWKTEVFELAKYIANEYYSKMRILEEGHFYDEADLYGIKYNAIKDSLKLLPTAGLGITNSDLEEIGANSYEEIDGTLREILAWKHSCRMRGDKFNSIKEERDAFLEEQQLLCYPYIVVHNVTLRHFNSEFKRKRMPIVISRDLYTGYNEELQDATYPYIKKHPEVNGVYALFTSPNHGFIINSESKLHIGNYTLINEKAYNE